jgi:hypothetical protein
MRSIGGGERFRFLEFHFLTAARKRAFAGFGAKNFGTAFFTFIALSKLTHSMSSLSYNCKRIPYFFISIGWPQHVTVPAPPRVTITSAPHLEHLYRLPTWFAIVPFPSIESTSLNNRCRILSGSHSRFFRFPVPVSRFPFGICYGIKQS